MSKSINKYFDNAATSFPKPAEVSQGVAEYINLVGGTYGRAAYGKVQQTTLLIEQCRDMMLEQMGGKNGYLCWTASATDAVNTLLSGMKLARVLVSGMEHNAVIRVLVGLGIEYDIAESREDGLVDIGKLSLKDMSKYSLVIINHQSNVNGVVQPIEKIKSVIGTVPILVDCSQSLGNSEFCADKWSVDYAVFTAHKGLYGVTGVGGFYTKDISKVGVTRFGGTGSQSESELMPDFYPDMFQYGTPNTVGIVGLYHAILSNPTSKHSFEDFVWLVDSVKSIEGVTLYVSKDYRDNKKQGEIFSFTFSRGGVSEVASDLWNKFEISTRSGLHCSPLAHKTLGTFSTGSIRVSLSRYHTREDINYLYSAIEQICK